MRQTFFEINGQRFDDDSYFHLTRVQWQETPTIIGDYGEAIVWPGFMLFEFWNAPTQSTINRDGYVFLFPTILAGQHINTPFLVTHRIVRYDETEMELISGGRINPVGDNSFFIHLTEMDEPKQMLVSAAVDWTNGKLRYNSEVP